MSKREALRDFADDLRGRDLLDFGAEFTRELVWELLDLQVPTVATMKVFSAIQLKELAAIDYVRNMLLGEGRYLAGTATGYRILSPAENRVQCDNYIESAQRKLNRALKLNKNMPREANDQSCQREARITMKIESLRSRPAGEQRVN